MVAIIGRKIPTAGYTVPPQDGIGNVFAAMAKPFLNTLDNDLKRAKLDEADRETGSIAGIQAAIEAARGGGDVNIYDLAKHGVAGSRKINDLADIMPMIYGNTRGAQHRSTTDALVGAGKGYGSTYHGVQDDFANKRTMQSMADTAATDRAVRVKGMDPVNIMVEGQPQVAPLSEARGARPVLSLTQEQGAFAGRNADNLDNLSPTEKSFISAEPSNKTPYTYVTPDGRSGTTVDSMTDAQSGERLPQGVQIKRLEGESADNLGGNTAVNRTMERRVTTEQARSAIKRLDEALQQPEAAASIGWLGTAAGMFNNVRAQTEAAVKLMNPNAKTLSEELSDPSVKAAADAVLGNPQLNQMAQRLGVSHAVLQSQVVNLAYLMAKAADPGGRISTPDFDNAMRIIGAAAMDPQAMRKVLAELDVQLDTNQQIWEREYSRIRNPGATPGAAAPTPQGGAVQRWERGPDGKPRLVTQ
jgi:hypothetical protein